MKFLISSWSVYLSVHVCLHFVTNSLSPLFLWFVCLWTRAYKICLYTCISIYLSIAVFYVSMPVSLYLYRLIFLPQGIQIYGRIHILFFYFIHFLFLSVYFTFTLYLVLCFFFSFYLFLCLRPLDFGAVDSNVLQSVTFEFDLQCTSYQWIQSRQN